MPSRLVCFAALCLPILGLPVTASTADVRKHQNRLRMMSSLGMSDGNEPTGALDAKATRQAEKLIKRQLRAGHVVILVSHDPSQVKRLASRKLIIRGGKVRVGRV